MYLTNYVAKVPYTIENYKRIIVNALLAILFDEK